MRLFVDLINGSALGVFSSFGSGDASEIVVWSFWNT